MKLHGALICLASVLCCSVSLLAASPPEKSYRAMPPAYQEAFDRGMAATRQHDWLAAISYFDQAYRVEGSTPPELYFNLGLAESMVPGRELRAMGWFYYYLHLSPDATNAASVRTELATLKTRTEATLDEIATKMKALAEQYPDEQRSVRACGYLAVTQARAGHFREALDVASNGKCLNKTNANVVVSVLHQIADAQSAFGDYNGAFQTIRSIDWNIDRYVALSTLTSDLLQAGSFALAESALNLAVMEHMCSQPDSAYLWEDIASAEFVAGQREAAMASAERALKAYDRSRQSVTGDNVNKVLVILIASGDWQRAKVTASRLQTAYNEEIFQKTLSLDKNSAIAELRLSSPNSKDFMFKWFEIRRRLYGEALFTDLRGAIVSIAKRETPDQILEGLSELSDKIYYTLLGINELKSNALPPLENASLSAAGASSPQNQPHATSTLPPEKVPQPPPASGQSGKGNYEALVSRGNTYYDEARWSEAITYYEQALEIQPTATNVMADLGACYRNTNRVDEALQMWEKALKINPTMKAALFNKAVVYVFDKKDKARGVEAIKAFQSVYPDDPMAKQLAEELAKQ